MHAHDGRRPLFDDVHAVVLAQLDVVGVQNRRGRRVAIGHADLLPIDLQVNGPLG